MIAAFVAHGAAFTAARVPREATPAVVPLLMAVSTFVAARLFRHRVDDTSAVLC